MMSEQPPCKIFHLCLKSRRVLQQNEYSNFLTGKAQHFPLTSFQSQQSNLLFVSFITFPKLAQGRKSTWKKNAL